MNVASRSIFLAGARLSSNRSMSVTLTADIRNVLRIYLSLLEKSKRVNRIVWRLAFPSFFFKTPLPVNQQRKEKKKKRSIQDEGERRGLCQRKISQQLSFLCKECFHYWLWSLAAKEESEIFRLLFLCLRDSDSCQTTQKRLTPVFHTPLSEGTLVVASL